MPGAHVRRKRKPHPVYSATRAAWDAFYGAAPAGTPLPILESIAAAALDYVRGRGRKVKRDAKHRLCAMIDCRDAHSRRPPSV